MRSLDLLDRWPVRAAAAGVLSADGTVDRSAVVAARGAGEVRQLRPGVSLVATTGELDRRFPWASVTKLCTALAVLVACEEGTLSLSEPAGPPGATVAHLLAHASGVAPDRREAIAPPGTRRIYSNAGYEIVGDLLAERAGMPASRYVAEAVFAPLGMAGARVPPGASVAYGAEGTLSDLLALAAELVAPRVVTAETLGAATAVAFPQLSGVLPGFGLQSPNDWGFGVEIRGAKHPHWTGSRNSPRTFGHFGRSGAFLWVDPVARAACCVLSDREFGPWAAEAWPALSDAVLQTLGHGPRETAGARAKGPAHG
jgi:CubicO group peptidase (beta-lactamase class C family)